MDDRDLWEGGRRPETVGEFMRVVTDAVIGGGIDLRCGQTVRLADLGHYARALISSGALEPVTETAGHHQAGLM